MNGKQLVFTTEEIDQIRQALWGASRMFVAQIPAYKMFCERVEQADNITEEQPIDTKCVACGDALMLCNCQPGVRA